MNGRPPAVVLGGSANAVSVARSLHAAGVEVWALGRRDSPVRHSRHCARFVPFSGGDALQAAWLDWLGGGPEGAVLLPCDDDGLELIGRNRKTLVGGGYLPFEANDEVLLRMLDKQTSYALARHAGIAAPGTFEPDGDQAVADMLAELRFPCAVKPIHSHVFQRRAENPAKALVVDSPDALHDALAFMRRLDVRPLVTEIVPGSDDQLCSYYSYLDEDGEPLLHLTKRKIRQYPAGFGLGCYHITDRNPEVADLGLRFFQSVGVRGLANVEFKRDARDGRLKLIECNHRFTAANGQLRAAGMDLALFCYCRLVGLPTPDVGSYRRDVRLWYPIDDTRAFLVHRRAGTLTFQQWIRSLWHAQEFPLFSLSDPKPTVVSTWWITRRLVARHSGWLRRWRSAWRGESDGSVAKR
jgi:predicted ATP-grasp superfamily ATP-dependent carboligase